MAYFEISTGLRGCYMSDNSFIVQCETRKELKQVIQYEAESYRDAGFIGANKRAIAHIAAIAWANRRKGFQLPYCLPLAPGHARDNYCHGIFVSNSNRAEYIAQAE
jgi:hypothetical protein